MKAGSPHPPPASPSPHGRVPTLQLHYYRGAQQAPVNPSSVSFPLWLLTSWTQWPCIQFYTHRAKRCKNWVHKEKRFSGFHATNISSLISVRAAVFARSSMWRTLRLNERQTEPRARAIRSHIDIRWCWGCCQEITGQTYWTSCK